MTIRVSSSQRRWRSLCPLSKLAAAAFIAAFLLSTLFILHALTPSSRSVQQFTPRLRTTAFLQKEAATKTELGRFGELMLGFLREDLPFTVFIPTPSSFDNILQAMSQRSNTSGKPISNSSVLTEPFEESNYAVISRLNLARLHPEGILVVNNLACNTVDIARGSIVIHLVDGVLMDSEFEQSVMPFRDDLDEESGMQ